MHYNSIKIGLSVSFFILYCSLFDLYAVEQDTLNQPGIFYIEPELLYGHIVPNHRKYPELDFAKAFCLSIGEFHNSRIKKWASFYNYPFTGILLSYCHLGNEKVLGDQYTILPFIVFNTKNRLNNSIYFKLGLGASYFTKHFDEEKNPSNLEIGSPITWTFQSFMYYSVLVTKHTSLNIGCGYVHSSNGHTQLPNFGINQGVLSLSFKYFTSEIDPLFSPKSNRIPISRNKIMYIMSRGGVGMHEYGNATGPVNGPKRMVTSASVSIGTIFREHIKADAGFSGRFYQHYYQSILNQVDSAYYDRPKLNSSNIYFFLGCEFIAGHIGIDIEGGLNLYKPYYRKHYSTMEGEIDFDYWLKQLFNVKLGLNYYLINTAKKPKANMFMGANINSNFGQADFSEICLGLVYSFY